jgi:hypothetical protein
MARTVRGFAAEYARLWLRRVRDACYPSHRSVESDVRLLSLRSG